MLATFVIGLREGLEAALIVGIVAAFLRRNGRSLVPMWAGVLAALTLSVAIGVTLGLVEASLPQAAQEGMEAVISAVAVVFVTSMVLWMNSHARGMKRELEASAQEAIGNGRSTALAVMAFLAVLKEGIETSVFLLATFQAASSTVAAAAGAVLGLAASVGLGWGLYRGSLRINLGRFFKITSLFLILVAAGLVVTTLRAAHEAAWLTVGQQRVVDLGWLAAPGTVQGSLLTGVLGIPADPRLVEVVAWFAYVVPMVLYLYWPASRRPSARAAQWIRYGVAGGLVVGAGTLALTVHAQPMARLGPAPIIDEAGLTIGTAVLWVDPDGSRYVVRDMGARRIVEQPLDVNDTHLHGDSAHTTSEVTLPNIDLPTTLTVEDLKKLNGGRLPIGISPQRSPGPFKAEWARDGTRDTWTTTDDAPQLLDLAQRAVTTVTVSGGGLTSPRTVSIQGQVFLPDGSTFGDGTWALSNEYVASAAAATAAARVAQAEATFWGRYVPLLLVAVAGLVLFSAWRHRKDTRPQLAVPDLTLSKQSHPAPVRHPLPSNEGAHHS